MTELDSWSKDLILAAKGADDPSEAQRARLRASILAATAGAGIAAGGATTALAGSTKSALWLKLLYTVVGIGAVSGIGYGVWIAAGAPGPSAATNPATHRVASHAAGGPPAATAATIALEEPASAGPQPSEDAQIEEEPAPGPAPAAKAYKPAVTAKSAPRLGLAQEVALIARARSAVQGGNAAEAQRLLAEHRREFPRGSLSLERSGLEVILACRSGGGKRQAKAFLQRFGKAPIAGSVRSACGNGE